MDTARTERGIFLYKDDPAFGEVYLRIAPKLAEDLEWAGTVLDRSDLPGMRDARADSPLGSSMLDSLRREFTLALTDKLTRGDDAGMWLAGPRRKGLGDVDTELSDDFGMLEVPSQQPPTSDLTGNSYWILIIC
mgnify:CR=1 FL=1